MPREKPQSQLELFDADFDRDVEEMGVSGALLKKEITAKAKALGKQFSASERAKAEKEIRKMVKDATSGAKELSTAAVIAVGRKINELRSYYASFTDLEGDHAQRYYPTEKNLISWAKHPDKSDMLGVDNHQETTATVGEKKGRKLGVFGIFKHK